MAGENELSHEGKEWNTNEMKGQERKQVMNGTREMKGTE